MFEPDTAMNPLRLEAASLVLERSIECVLARKCTVLGWYSRGLGKFATIMGFQHILLSV